MFWLNGIDIGGRMIPSGNLFFTERAGWMDVWDLNKQELEPFSLKFSAFWGEWEGFMIGDRRAVPLFNYTLVIFYIWGKEHTKSQCCLSRIKLGTNRCVDWAALLRTTSIFLLRLTPHLSRSHFTIGWLTDCHSVCLSVCLSTCLSVCLSWCRAPFGTNDHF